MNNILLLGSKSQSRQMLLSEAQIPFKLITQDADESQCDWGLPLQQLVEEIALHKMNHVVLPSGQSDGDICFVLTADTMVHDKQGTIHGKPTDKSDAIAKIKAVRSGARVSTAFCLDRNVWQQSAWKIDQRIAECVHAEYEFIIPDAWIDTYFEKSIGLQCAGGTAIEAYGNMFLKSVHGSYSTIVGLPMFEVRQALENIGFF